MKNRCYNTNTPNYHAYGGRGITVCDEWRNDFQAFYDWAYENGYDENAERGECTIDRIDVNGNYCPKNCRWVGQEIQNLNKRPSSEWLKSGVYVEINGVTKNITDWCKEYKISYATVMDRVHIHKWDYVKAITTPPYKNTTHIEYNGERLTLTEAAKKYNINSGTLLTRLKFGWTIDKAIETPILTKYRKKGSKTV